MIPHLAVSSFYLFLYHTLVDLFFFKTDSLHDIFSVLPCIPVVRTRKARILLKYFSAPESYVPVHQLFLHSFSIAIASAVVWNVMTSFNSFFLIIQSQFQIQSPSR